MAFAVSVRTPSDFEKTIGAEEYLPCTLAKPNPLVEPLLRKSLDEIFSDLQYISTDERDVVASYLNSIEEPLDNLWAMGFMIFAIVTSGTLKTPEGSSISNWRRTYYLVVPKEGFFRVGRELSATVHRFDANCDDGVTALSKAAKEKTPVATWSSPEPIKESLEGNVPWCICCCLDQMGA
jgi:hypothetical protein